MNRYQHLRIFGSGVTPPPTGIKVVGLNSTESVTFSHAGYYTNLWNAIQWDYHFESGTPFPNNAFTVGWLVNNIPNTTKYWSYLINNMPGDVGFWKSGTYHILWEGGADPTVTIVASGLYVGGSLTRISAGHWTFQTTGLEPLNNNNFIQVHFQNTTGATITAATMHTEAVVHDDHYALWQSGSWDRNVNPDYLAWAGANIGRFRMAKVSGTENSWVTTDVSRSLITEDWKFWGASDYLIGIPGNEMPGIAKYGSLITTGMPYSFAAKLCAKLGQAIVHASAPLGCSDDVFNAIAAQIAGETHFTGYVLGEPGNENWNGGYQGPGGDPAYAYLQGAYKTQYNAPPYSAGINVWPEGEAHACLRYYKALKNALGEGRTIPAYCAQYIVPSYGPIQLALNYVDVGNVAGYGILPLKRILNEHGGAYLAAAYNTPTMPDGTWLFNANYGYYDWQALTDDQVKAFFVKGQESLTSYTAELIAELVLQMPNVLRLCYEWGHQVNGSCSGAGLFTQFNINVTNSTMVWDVSGQLSGAPNPGDQWTYYQNTNDGYKTPNNLGHEYAVYVRQRLGNPNECYAYTTKAAAVFPYANDAAARAAAIAFFDNGNTQPFWGGPITRIQQASVRIQAWLDGPYGAEMYNALFAGTIGSNLWQQANQLNDIGSYTSNIHSDGEATASAKAYGLQKRITDARTPRANAYLNKTSY
jgi:hypothetical protein